MPLPLMVAMISIIAGKFDIEFKVDLTKMLPLIIHVWNCTRNMYFFESNQPFYSHTSNSKTNICTRQKKLEIYST